MKRDNLHYNIREIQGYNLPFNAVISEREAGKTTSMWLDLIYAAYKQGYTSIVVRRQINDITEAYIESCEQCINKFNEDHPVKIAFNKGSLKEGVVDVSIVEEKAKKPFIRIIALSNPVSRIKSLIVRNLRYIVYDEFICNPKFKEKYLPDEATRFKEMYNTFQRESSSLKAFWFGNPYSHYNPFFMWWGVDTKKLKQGTIQRGKNWVVQCYRMKDELKALILERNPLYQFDDAYKRYAFDGEAVNDANIKLAELPQNYHLQYSFKVEGKYIGIYQNNLIEDLEDRFFCQFVDTLSARRTTYCFDFNELVERTALLSREDRMKFDRFKKAIRKRSVSFKSIEVYYLIEEVYNNI